MVRKELPVGSVWRRWAVGALALLSLTSLASQAMAGSTILVMPTVLTTDEAYDRNGDKVSLGGDVVVPNLGLGYVYSFPLKIRGAENWNPSLNVTVLYWFAKVDGPAPGATTGWKSIFLWPMVGFGSKYLDLSIGYEIDLDDSRAITDQSDALTLSGTVKYPFGNFEVGAGVDYYWTFQQENDVDWPNWLIVRGTGTYSFSITEDVKGNIGLMVAYYFLSESPVLDNDNGNWFLIRPFIGVSHGKFSFTVAWGTVDEYTTGGISFSGKNAIVKKAKGFRAFLGYSF